MLEKWFHLTENNATVRKEIVAGFTTFLTMMYILFVNSRVLSEVGMPVQGVFAATALSAAVCTIIMSLFANVPVAMAPGMGLNTVFVNTICLSMGYHWKEALAITFLAGVSHIIIMCSPLRKAFVKAFPEYLRVAAATGLGLFIGYVGIKNAGFLNFTSLAGQYEQLSNGIIISDSSTVPGMVRVFTSTQVIAIIGLFIMIALRALEKKTGEQYAALPLGILIATFIGIPMNITRLDGILAIDTSVIQDFKQVFLSFFGTPGICSIFANPEKMLCSLLMILILDMTNVLDSVGTMIGVGQIHDARLFDEKEMKRFSGKGAGSKIDRTLIANSFGSAVSPLIGTSTATIFIESVTGIISGGRTGLTGLVTGILFLLCLSLSGLFHIIPSEAVAPALILAGNSMLMQRNRINWKNYEESLPSFLTILFMVLSYSILDGIAVGILAHVVIQLAIGKRKEISPFLMLISILYVILKISENLLIV